jgi:hypothetical protein
MGDSLEAVRTYANCDLDLGDVADFCSEYQCAYKPTVPLPQLKVKPSHGDISLQTVMSDLAATDSCPARKIPTIAVLYAPKPNFVGVDTVQIEFEASGKRLPSFNLRITVNDIDSK